MRIRHKQSRITKEVLSKICFTVASDFDIATLCCDENEDLSKYDHLSKKSKMKPSSKLYIPFGLDKREDDFSGKLLVYDYDNDIRRYYNFKYWLSLQKNNRYRKDPVNTELVKYLPKLRKNEFIENVAWVYPYYFFRLPIEGT
jgi:hypothetical protein